jgi:ABC-type branched-subunit amino acid transport system ATPase component
MNTEGPVLSAEGIVVRFGGLTAVNDVSLELYEGRTTGLMGSNGAGKTTLFNTLSGHQPMTEGKVSIRGRDVSRLAAHRRARLGLARTFQLGGLVDDLTVLENIVLGLDHHKRIDGPRLRRRLLRERALEHLERHGLADVASAIGEELGAGLRRRVEVARCLAAGASILLLDEPAAGLTTNERNELAEFLRMVVDDGAALLITEHSAEFLLAVSDEIIVMNFGKELRRGAPSQIKNDPAVIAAYLG